MNDQPPPGRAAWEAEMFRLLAEHVRDYAIFIVDRKGRVQSWSQGAERLLGWTESEIVGQMSSCFFTPEDVDAGVPEWERQQAASTGRGEDDRWHVRKDGSRFWSSGVMTPLRDDAGRLLGFAKIMRDRTELKQAEEDRRGAKALHEAIMETALDAIVTIDHEDRIIEFNPAAEEIFGYSRTDVLGRPIVELIVPPSLREAHLRGMTHYLATGEGPVLGKRIEMPALRSDGTEFPVELAITRIPTDGPPLFTAHLRDITQRVRAEQLRNARLAVTQVLARATTLPEAGMGVLQAVCENLGWDLGFLWMLDPQGQELQCYESWHMPGRPAPAFETSSRQRTFRPGEGLPGHVWATGQPAWIFDVTQAENFPRLREAAEDGLGAAFGCPILLDGKMLAVIEFFSRQVQDTESELLDMMMSVAGQMGQFIERRRAEERLQQQRNWLQTVLSSIGDAVIATDTEGKVTFLNPIAEALTGWAQDQACGAPLQDVFQIVHAQSRQPVEAPIHSIRQKGNAVGMERYMLLIARDGTERPIEHSASPIQDEHGAASGIVLVFHDVTEQRQAERELRRSEEQARTILESITDSFFALDRDWRFTYVNYQAEVLLGRTREELLGRSIWEEFPQAVGTEFDRNYRRAVAENVSITFEEFYPAHDRWYEVHAYPSEDGLSVYFRDATQRRRAEEALRVAYGELEARVAERTAELAKTNQFLKALLESIQDGIVACDAQGILTLFNRASREFHERPGEPIPAEQWAEHYNLYHADGKTRLSMEEIPLYRALQGERIENVEFLIIPPNHSPRTLLTSGQAFFDDQGNKLGAVVSLHDITERKQAEEALRNAQEELERRVEQRTEELARANQALREADRRKDEFLAMLAHELRNPLAPIRSGLDVLTLADCDHEILEPMQQQVEYLVRLVDDLLDVSRIMRGRVELRKEPTELASAVTRAVDTVRPMIDAHRQNLTVSIPPESIWLNADSVRLAQVISNLLNNASKYTDENGSIWLTVRQEDTEAVISVRDTGIGIEPELQPRVFDLFTQSQQSIDRSQGGLGIGLTVVKSLIEMHDGTVSVQSAGLGQGSEFTIRLPAISPAERRAREAEGQSPTSGHHILVVDDNLAAARMLGLLLKKLGNNEISIVHDGPSALKAAQQHRPDIILLDIGLPKMDGYTVARHLRQQPEFERTLIVALTGYGTEEDRHKSLHAGCDEHLVKPPSVQSLKDILVHPKLPTVRP